MSACGTPGEGNQANFFMKPGLTCQGFCWFHQAFATAALYKHTGRRRQADVVAVQGRVPPGDAAGSGRAVPAVRGLAGGQPARCCHHRQRLPARAASTHVVNVLLILQSGPTSCGYRGGGKRLLNGQPACARHHRRRLSACATFQKKSRNFRDAIRSSDKPLVFHPCSAAKLLTLVPSNNGFLYAGNQCVHCQS